MRRRARDRAVSRVLGRTRSVKTGMAALALALGILAGFASVASAASPRRLDGPPARSASATGDCDGDGDSPYGTEFEECSPAPAEPGKIYTPAQKARFDETYVKLLRAYAETCGNGYSDPLTYLRFAFGPVLLDCTLMSYTVTHQEVLVEDPPQASAFMVALPAVQAPTGGKGHCHRARAICRRGRRLGRAFTYTLEQEAAAIGALATSLDRLSSTPPGAESQFGTGAGSAPLDSRRTQVAAGRLYSGLLAAWSDRYKAARRNLAKFLDGLGNGKVRRAANKLAPVLPSAPLWETFHRMNVFEVAQLFSDLTAQNVLNLQQQPSASLKAKVESGIYGLDQDMYLLYQATRARRSSRARRVAAAAHRFKHDADQFAAIPGLAEIAPNAPLSARLFGFAVEGLTTKQPAPVAAP